MANSNNTVSIGFEQQIWAAADILRGNMNAAEYKHVVLGLIFLKYIPDKFEARYQKLLADDDDVEDKDAYAEVNVFFVPLSGNANFAWLQHMILHLSPNGKIGMVLANGSLSSQSGGEGEIRRKIVEDDLVEGIIAMPTQLFYTTQIPVSFWFISRNKAQKGKTLFIDARKMGTMVNRRLREMTPEDIAKIAAAFEAFDAGTLEDVKGYCAAVTTAEIAKQDYILTPGRYVGIEEQKDDGEPFEEKMAWLTGELSGMFKRSREMEYEIRKRLGSIGYDI